MAKSSTTFETTQAFYQQLRYIYLFNKDKIHSSYKRLTKKFLSYNDPDRNPEAFLRRPQFEALEMYVFIKEFLGSEEIGNEQVDVMFDNWRKNSGKFAGLKYSKKMGAKQIDLFENISVEQNKKIFEQMKKYKEEYPNYIYALTMGLGKTILMATCILYEFLLAKKYPKDKRFCHNALVFAPDKTVLESLREIVTFDKSKVVPKEYVGNLDKVIHFHFLEQDSTSLNTTDDSKFNIIISNNQKLIVKKKRVSEKPAEKLFATPILASVYGDDVNGGDNEALIMNQRFEKLCRLSQLGVYVDEAHHLFGSELEKNLRAGKGEKTSLRNTINILHSKSPIVACFNYTGTPYVERQVLPEVVYAYGLGESIANGYLKDANPQGYKNVKGEDFLRNVVKSFWDTYGGKEYENLNPKLAIFAATVEEAVKVVRPALERILSELGISISSILTNVGDKKITKDNDIRDFNNLDVPGTEGNKKQFIILVGKGKEGWNCRSLLGIAMYRSPKKKVFVLQATMRCLRQLSNEQLKATIFLSKDNYDILNEELEKNYNMQISDLNKTSTRAKKTYQVRVMEPPHFITMKQIKYIYSLKEKGYREPISFDVKNIDTEKYKAVVYSKKTLRYDTSTTEEKLSDVRSKMKYSKFSLVGEIARYLNLSCLVIDRIITEAEDGEEAILSKVNEYNEVLEDIIIPKIFHTLYEVVQETQTTTKKLCLLNKPEGREYYEYRADPELVIEKDTSNFNSKELAKTFHADTYCFDSEPEKKCYLQYINSDKVEKIYFTGMFTANQGELAVYYFDTESKSVRRYYPDFVAEMKGGSYRLIEVKGDHMIDDSVVKAKAEAAEEIAEVSGMEYVMYKSSDVMRYNVLDKVEYNYVAKLFEKNSTSKR